MNYQRFGLRLRFAAAITLLFSISVSNAQVQTPRYNNVSGACGGYFEYLPQGYNSNTWQSYPVIIFIHGLYEGGNGTSDLGNILNCWTSLPRLIANGGFPNSFNVGGQNHSFIVLSPQFRWWPSANDVNDVIDFAIRTYRVDQSRIYVTGLSMGGGATWDFAGSYPTKAAAIVPICGAAGPDGGKAQAIASARLGVWATHNQDDWSVPTSNTTGWVSVLSQDGADVQSTIFQASGHDAWSRTYDPGFTQNGLNVYQWMLQHKRSGGGGTSPAPAPNQSPTANAGGNQTITLPSNSVSLSGSGSDPDGTINFYEWKQASGPSQANIGSAYGANTPVYNLVQGSYVFTLTVTDNRGATATSNVTITVNASLAASIPPTGSTRIEAENYTNMNGIQKENTSDAGGGQNVGYIDYGDWMDYNVNVSSGGTYAINLRVATPSGGQLQIKNSAGTVLATVSVPNTGGYQSWQTISANISLAAGSQTIRVYSTSNGWNFNWLEIEGTSAAITSKEVATSDVVASTTSSLNIYPNPIVNSFQLQINNELTGTVAVQVYDMQGRVQKQFSLSKTDAGASQFYLSIGELAAANYIIKVTMSDWTQSKQIIKQ